MTFHVHARRLAATSQAWTGKLTHMHELAQGTLVHLLGYLLELHSVCVENVIRCMYLRVGALDAREKEECGTHAHVAMIFACSCMAFAVSLAHMPTKMPG